MKKNIVIIGAGAAGLMLAAHLDINKYNITIYEKNKNAGRKLLVAGDGGLNITHAEATEILKKRYYPNAFLDKCLDSFSNTDLIHWLQNNNIETFKGSSDRIFPIETIKPIDVVNKFLSILEHKKIAIHYAHTWLGWNNNNELIFETNSGIQKMVSADYTIFSLGGGSWKSTGSNDLWHQYFINKNIKCNPFEASNCRLILDSSINITLFKNLILKNISVSFETFKKTGDIIIDQNSLEGTPIYWLSHFVRNKLKENNTVEILIDLKPQFTELEIYNKLTAKSKRNSIANHLNTTLNLNQNHILLLKQFSSKEDFTDFKKLAFLIKNIPIKISSLGAVDEAISTVGGIALDEINDNFELIKMSNNFVIGEMLDWDAPTGGYLLQANFSMAVYVAQYFNAQIEK